MSTAADRGANKRRRLKPELRRAEILSTATRLIAERGYNGVSIQAIADACGIAKSGVLHHFPDKASILIGVLEARDERDRGIAVRPAGEMLDRETARARMDQLVLNNFEQREIIHLFTVLSSEALDPSHPAHDYFNRRLELTRAALRDGCANWHPDPQRLADQTLAFLDGLQLMWLRDPSLPYATLWADFADRIEVS
jgi:AcrR family transcriptional regulator